MTTIRTDYPHKSLRVNQLNKLKRLVPVLEKEGSTSESLLIKVKQAIKIMEDQND